MGLFLHSTFLQFYQQDSVEQIVIHRTMQDKESQVQLQHILCQPGLCTSVSLSVSNSAAKTLPCQPHSEKWWEMGARFMLSPGQCLVGSLQKQFFSSERTKVPAFLSLPFWSLGRLPCEWPAAIYGPLMLCVKPQSLPRGKSGRKEGAPGDFAFGLGCHRPRCSSYSITETHHERLG